MKTSRREFLKLGGKAAIAATAVGAGLAINSVPAAVSAETATAVKPITVPNAESLHVNDPRDAAGAYHIHTKDMIIRSWHMEEQSQPLALGQRGPTTRAFSFDVALEEGMPDGLRDCFMMNSMRDKCVLHIDHDDAPHHLRGRWNVVVTETEISASANEFMLASIKLQEVM